MQPRDLLLSHKATLENLIAANRAAQVDRIDRMRLDAITAQACRYLVRVRDGLNNPHKADELALQLGPNGHGPAIADLVKQSEHIRRGFVPFEEGFEVLEAAE